jgi:hypothetical protein
MSIIRWNTEFTEDYAVPEEIIALVIASGKNKLVDISWHNDTAPSFSPLNKDEFQIFVDHPDPAKRELAGKRFVVAHEDEDGNIDIALATDGLIELLGYLESAHGLPKSMTFSEFQSTAVAYEDIGTVLGDSDMAGLAGRLYLDQTTWIEDTASWPKAEAGQRTVRKWYTRIANAEYHSDSLEEIEKHLFKYAVHEGMTVKGK